MKRLAAVLLALAVGAAAPAPSVDQAKADQTAFQAYFRTRFPNVKFADFGNGPYAVNAAMRKQWEEIMQFPPYDFALDAGKTAFETKFANGRSYADCFAHGGIGIRQNYPYFDGKTGEVVTLDGAINKCRTDNGEKPLKYSTGMMAAIDAYMAETSRATRWRRCWMRWRSGRILIRRIARRTGRSITPSRRSRPAIAATPIAFSSTSKLKASLSRSRSGCCGRRCRQRAPW